MRTKSTVGKQPGIPSKGNLKFSYWNINGWKSRTIGNKLIDNDFLREMQHSDIISLGETHIHDGTLEKLCIPGFTLVTYTNKPINPKSKTAPGGG